MFLSVYQNKNGIAVLSYQSQLFLPQLYSADLGKTLLEYINQKTLPEFFSVFSAAEKEILLLHQCLFDSIQIIFQNEYLCNHIPSFRDLPILYHQKEKKAAFQTGEKLSFHSTYEYNAVTGIIQIYEISTLQEALAIELMEYQKAVALHMLPPFKICPQCHTCFVSKRNDALFCSQNCVEKNFKKQKKKDPYYIKYRSLQQYYNKKVNKWGQQLPSSAQLYKKQYGLWQTLAKREYEKLSTLSPEELPDIPSFVKKLKGYWTIATVKTKK